MNKHAATLVVVLMLFVGVVVTFRGRSVEGRMMPNDIISSMPAEIDGWRGEDQPIADTPEMQRAVNEMLNYDEAVFRTYSKGGQSLSVYAAYWNRGRFHPRLIALHTPDVCWRSNGMTPIAANYNYEAELGEHPLWHAQWRKFDANGNPVYVIYWHILNGRLSGYAEGPNSGSRRFLDNLWRDLQEGIGQQYFIRVSSNTSFDYWRDQPLFQEILRHFAPVLYADAAEEK